MSALGRDQQRQYGNLSGRQDGNDGTNNLAQKESELIYPLVLPTMADFCYGHCYPLHRILEYFYGGMKQIMCSVDDPKQVETEMKQYKLSPGQDRMNFQCWLKEDIGASSAQADNNEKLLQMRLGKLGQLDIPDTRHGSTAS